MVASVQSSVLRLPSGELQMGVTQLGNDLLRLNFCLGVGRVLVQVQSLDQFSPMRPNQVLVNSFTGLILAFEVGPSVREPGDPMRATLRWLDAPRSRCSG